MDTRKITPHNYYMSNSKQYNINTYIDRQTRNTYVTKTRKEYRNERKTQRHNEVVDPALGVDVTKYSSFFDIGACPGAHTSYIFEKNPEIMGYGISLHPDEGGYKLNDEMYLNDRYSFKYFNLLTEDQNKLNYVPKVDLVLAECFINHNKENPEYKRIKNSRDLTDLSKKLQRNSFDIGLSKLKKGGDIQVVFSFGWTIDYLIDTIIFLRNHFNNVKYYKDGEIVADISVVWIFATGYHGNVTQKNLSEYMNGKLWTLQSLKHETKYIDEIYRPINLFILKNL